MKNKHIISIVIATSLLCGCSKQQNIDDAEIERRAQKIVEEKLRNASQENAQIEAIKIAEQKALIEASAAEQRQRIAADMTARAAVLEAKREELSSRAATEKIRREMIAIDVKSYVDLIRISSTSIGNRIDYSIEGRDAKKDMIFASPAGYTVTYKGKEADYFIFEYSEPQFTLTLKRALNDLSLATIQHTQPLAEGISGTDGPLQLPSAITSDARQMSVSITGGLIIMKATYGADSVQKDVKEIVKQKVHSGRLDFDAHSGELGGDPIFGKVKTFYIEYISQGRLVKKSFREGEHVVIP